MLGCRVLTNRTEDEIINAQKGRDANLVRKRNNALVYRYYMYNTQSKMSYPDIIETISDEFYLAPRTITNILSSHLDDLKKIRKEKPPLSLLSKKYPQFDWSIKAVTMMI